MGSLATAAFLARDGRRVLVLEKHYTPGGFTHVFKRKGYEWDVGLHYVGELDRPGTMMNRLFDYVTDGGLQWADMGDVYDRIRFGDTTYDFHKGIEGFKAGLAEHFPSAGDQRAIGEYVRLVQHVVRQARSFFIPKALPPLIGRPLTAVIAREFHRWSDRTTLDVLQGLTSNKRLIGVLCGQYGDYGLSPSQSSFAIHCMVARHYFGGAFYPVGGSGAIAEHVAPVLQAAGGLIVTNAEVAEIVVRKNRAAGVRLADGRVLESKLVVSGAGYINTIRHLLPDDVVAKHGLDRTLPRVRPSAAHVCAYLGFRESAEALSMPKANYWLYPDDYDHDANLRRFMADPEQPFPVTYISFPAAKDPAFLGRFPGRSTVEIITIAPFEWFAPWAETRWRKRGADYDALKDRFMDRLLERLYEAEPQLRGKVDHAELSTPLSTAHFAGYETGEIYGLDHRPDRFRQDFLRARTPVSGVYLTGQDIATAGIGGALAAGLVTAGAILNRNVMSRVMAPRK